MKKRWIACAGGALLISVFAIETVFAANNMKLFIGDKEVKSDSQLQIVQGNIVGPIKQIVEELGGSIELDEKRQTVSIKDFKELQVEQLEHALIPIDKHKAAELWAESAVSRNGALRYAILSPELKKKQYSAYKELNWVIGGSSPWVESYKIIEKGAIDKDTYKYEIDYILTDSTAEKYTASENITVKNFDSKWFVINGDEPSYDIPIK